MVPIKEIKSGDIIIYRGKRLQVIQFDGGLAAVNGKESKWMPLTSAYEGATELFRPKSNYALALALLEDTKLSICNYDPIVPEISEFTLEEIASKIGVDIKKLRIKE